MKTSTNGHIREGRKTHWPSTLASRIFNQRMVQWALTSRREDSEETE